MLRRLLDKISGKSSQEKLKQAQCLTIVELMRLSAPVWEEYRKRREMFENANAKNRQISTIDQYRVVDVEYRVVDPNDE